MSKRKGMSLEEKRDKLLEVFHESSDVFVLKDVEKLGIKKGINGQTIKDVLQSLVDDNLVRQEKIGASNYFWSFPSDASVKLEHEVAQAEKQLADLKRRRVDLAAEVKVEMTGREDTAQRAQLMETLTSLRQQVAAAQATLDSYRDQDPETVQAIRDGAAVAKAAANRWLDNLHCLTSWCKRQFPGRENELDEFFVENGYRESMDYIE